MFLFHYEIRLILSAAHKFSSTCLLLFYRHVWASDTSSPDCLTFYYHFYFNLVQIILNLRSLTSANFHDVSSAVHNFKMVDWRIESRNSRSVWFMLFKQQFHCNFLFRFLYFNCHRWRISCLLSAWIISLQRGFVKNFSRNT